MRVNGYYFDFGFPPLHYPLFGFIAVFFPLIGFFWSLHFVYFFNFSSKTDFYVKQSIHLFFTVIPFFISLNFFIQFLNGDLKSFRSFLYKGLDLRFSDFVLDIVLRFDPLSVTMMFIVTLVSLLVQIYSLGYMSDDPNLHRFMAYLSLFTFFMLVLVTANNLVQIFLGWEGVGLVSFLLVNFWYTRTQAVKSAIKALLVNKVGDFFLIIAIVFIYVNFYSLDFDVIKAITPYLAHVNLTFFSYEFSLLNLIAILIFFAAVGKSAQLGLHTWLPDAMEGPTPVSALIHAATMVTAGVYLLIRFSFLFEFAYTARLFLIFFGSVTALFGATVALFQNDIKRVIAYSTCSQLGYMVFTCGLSNYSLAMFHLVNHAFFKALLFLSAGVVIHALHGEQDMRRMGGLVRLLPFTYNCMLISSLSLMGFPFLTGFYSKDIILSSALAFGTGVSSFAYYLGLLSALFTAAYSAKLLYLTFLTLPNGYRERYNFVHEGPLFMTLPQIVLLFGSVFFGFLFSDAAIGMGTNFWQDSIFINFQNATNLLNAEFSLTSFSKMLPVYLSLLSFYLTFCFYKFGRLWFNYYDYLPLFQPFYKFFNKRWYFDLVYNQFIIKPFLHFSYYIAYKGLDRGLIEWIGPYGLVRGFAKISDDVSNVHSGNVHDYLGWIVYSILLIIWWYFIIWFYVNNFSTIDDWYVFATFWFPTEYLDEFWKRLWS